MSFAKKVPLLVHPHAEVDGPYCGPLCQYIETSPYQTKAPWCDLFQTRLVRSDHGHVRAEQCAMAETAVLRGASTLRRYDLPSIRGEGYAFIVIDTKDGYFSTVSDWGHYAFRWSAPGGEFRDFLAQLNPDYLHSKLMSGRADMRVFDGEATKAAVVKELTEFAELDPEQAAEEILLLEDHDVETEEGFSEWLRETKLADAHSLSQTEPEPQCWAFCTKVWPRFAEMLRAELAAEAASA